MGQFWLFITDRAKATFKTNTHILSYILFHLLGRQLKYCFSHMNHPRTIEDHATNIFVSYIEGVGLNWCYKVFCDKKFHFGGVHDTEKEIQRSRIWIFTWVSMIKWLIYPLKILRWYIVGMFLEKRDKNGYIYWGLYCFCILYFWPFYKYLYLIWKYYSVLIIIFQYVYLSTVQVRALIIG